MASWGFSYQIKTDFGNNEYWNKQIPFGLPDSKKNKNHSYTPNQLHSILTSRDGEFTIGHLQTLFSLFEDLLNERKTLQEFIGEFTEDNDIENKRKDARKILGLSDDTSDLEIINDKYKILAKEHHPDMSNGDSEKFKIASCAG